MKKSVLVIEGDDMVRNYVDGILGNDYGETIMNGGKKKKFVLRRNEDDAATTNAPLYGDSYDGVQDLQAVMPLTMLARAFDESHPLDWKTVGSTTTTASATIV